MQIEGLVIGENIRMSDLKGTLDTLAKKMFGADREIRLRPSFFPFTEPSVEMDISCFKCGGSGCNVCKGTGWIEILGAGMVHPNVLEMAGYDPKKSFRLCIWYRCRTYCDVKIWCRRYSSFLHK